MSRLCTLLCLLSLLAGCAEKSPQAFGVSLDTWNNLPATQQQELIGRYSVNNLSRYSTEPKVTMDATPPLTKPQPRINVAKKPLTVAAPKPSASILNVTPEKIKTSTPATPQPAIQDNWLTLDNPKNPS